VDPVNPKVPIVKVKVGKRLKRPKTLAEIKAEPIFANSPLVVIGRLSVVPLTRSNGSGFWHRNQSASARPSSEIEIR